VSAGSGAAAGSCNSYDGSSQHQTGKNLFHDFLDLKMKAQISEKSIAVQHFFFK
jgi:hypothetical protein